MIDQFHVVTGLPRSGSTLLCNLLMQNPDFHAGSTSPIAQTVAGVANFWSQSAEIKSELAHNKAVAEKSMRQFLRGGIEGWYDNRTEKPVVFDKGRGWMTMVDRLIALYPAAKLLCCVRDPRDVFASIQKQHAQNPILDDAPQATVVDRASAMFSPQGIIGGPLTHLEDQIQRRSKAVVPVVFEKLVDDPERELRKLYAELKIDYFKAHDFNAVEDTSTDLDALYNGKFPHEGSGKVEKPDGGWQDHVPAELGAQIVNRYPIYAKLFGYA